MDWVSYDAVLSAGKGEAGGRRAAADYRRFVESGWKERTGNPFDGAHQGWILGGEKFIQRIRRMVEEKGSAEQTPKARRLKRLELQQVLKAVAEFYDVSPHVFRRKRAAERGRNVAAWLARQLTQATLRELAPYFGLSHPESLSNLTRRVEHSRKTSPKLRKEIALIKRQLP